MIMYSIWSFLILCFLVALILDIPLHIGVGTRGAEFCIGYNCCQHTVYLNK